MAPTFTTGINGYSRVPFYRGGGTWRWSRLGVKSSGQACFERPTRHPYNMSGALTYGLNLEDSWVLGYVGRQGCG